MQPHPEIDVAQARAFWKSHSQGLYAVPRAWARKGENLIHAFQAVSAASEPGAMHLNMRDQALMLAGMAIEVQLKAILVNSPTVRTVVTGGQPQKSDPDFKLWQRFFSHNLLELALEAGLTLTVAE
jgi:hypothetical protein